MVVMLCRYCHKQFQATNKLQVHCGPICQAAAGRKRARDKARAEYASWKEPAKRDGRSPYGPCGTCANWQRESDPAYEMGGWCRLEAVNTCKPWGAALLRKEATA